jgi:hypothetical protein
MHAPFPSNDVPYSHSLLDVFLTSIIRTTCVSVKLLACSTERHCAPSELACMFGRCVRPVTNSADVPSCCT